MSPNLREAIRGSGIYAPIRRWRLERMTRQPGYMPDWQRLLVGHEAEWKAALSSARGPRIAIASSLGLNSTVNTIDGLIAIALTLRGAQVELVFCDGVLPACQVIEHTLVPSVGRIAAHGPHADFCEACIRAGERTYAPTGLKVRRLSAQLTPTDHATAEEFGRNGPMEGEQWASIEEHAKAGALRFFGRAELGADAHSGEIHRRYRQAAYLTWRAAEALFAPGQYDCVLAHHGIYVPQGQIADVARRSGTRLVTWHTAYRRGRVIFQHRDTYHREMIREPISAWGQRALSPEEDEALELYLKSRETGAQDWVSFQRQAPGSQGALYAELNLHASKPVYLAAANVAWDARLHYPGSAYGHMIDWAVDTVRWFAGQPDKQLVVRCHPGEVMSSPRAQDRLDHALKATFPQMPANVRIVTPEMETNTYALARIAAGTLIYNTKMGVELAARGLPVVVAGDAWIRGKGFSADASDPASYRALLELPDTFKPLDTQQIDLARRYAFHFFFRRCLEISALNQASGWPLTRLREDAVSRAMPGHDAGIDTICRGILEGTPFEAADPLSRAR